MRHGSMIVVDGRRGGAVSSAPALLGRRTERALIEQLIADPAPRPRGIALAGEAGIGKTILWQAGIEYAAAHGRPVLSTRGTEPDTDVSFAALGELLAPVVADAWDVLP